MGATLGAAILGAMVLGSQAPVPIGFQPGWALYSNSVVQKTRIDP